MKNIQRKWIYSKLFFTVTIIIYDNKIWYDLEMKGIYKEMKHIVVSILRKNSLQAAAIASSVSAVPVIQSGTRKSIFSRCIFAFRTFIFPFLTSWNCISSCHSICFFPSGHFYYYYNCCSTRSDHYNQVY